MNDTKRHPDVDTLCALQPIGRLNATQLELLSQVLQIHRANKGDTLIQLGDTERFNLYLLNGKLRLRSADGRITNIDDQSAQARKSIAHLIPRHYEVIAQSPVDYLRVDDELMDGLLTDETEGITATELPMEEEPQNRDTLENLLSRALLKDLEHDCLILPSLPDVAIRVGRAMRDENSNAHKLGKIIQTDPVITAKLIRAANSPLYAGIKPVDSCAAAVVRLGADTTHKLVLTFALRELFNTNSPVMKAQMHQLWEHSVKVSAVCYVLAKITGVFNPEHALLAGLLHDIGSVAILSYAERFPEINRDETKLKQVILDMHGLIGSRILKAWGFTDDLVMVAEEAENWLRDGEHPADYVDLVIIAQLHCYIGTPRMQELPSLDQVPAFKKLGIEELSPRLSIKILDKAEEKIKRTQSLLK